MALEHWDASRRKWILYTSEEKHRADCEKYPFKNVPSRIFLDTNVVNLLIKYGASIFELEQIPSTLTESRADEIEALMHIFQVGRHAHWDLVASEKTMQEISLTPDQDVRDDLLEYVVGLVEIGTEDSKHAYSLGLRLADASIASALPDRNDRELLGNAVGFGCDVFCTCDQKTIISKRHLLPQLGLRILTPIEWWAHLKPWAGLF